MAVTAAAPVRRLPVVDEGARAYEHPLYEPLLTVPGLSVAVTLLDRLLEWGTSNALWIFPMATSCCGIELMSAAASRVDLDRMGSIVRATPRQADVMVIAGTITTKMAPRVKALWEQMPEPKWAIAMGSCAISGDFYRNLYPVIPGIDTVVPVDVYIPGCPPNPEALMAGLMRLQEKIRQLRAGSLPAQEPKPHALDLTRPSIARVGDPSRPAELDQAQEDAAGCSTALDLDDERGASASPENIPATNDARDPSIDEDLDGILRDHGVSEVPKDAAPVVPLTRHVALARRLRAAGYSQLVYVVATHFPASASKGEAPDRFEVAYALRSVGAGSRLVTWRVVPDLPEADQGGAPSVPSIVGVFAGADWQEREQYDLVGVRFTGHPDLRRIMLPDSWVGHPLRRDYSSDTACPPWR
jgi:NADH-quinone oxidoreductase subunit B/C/D